jgi:transposase
MICRQTRVREVSVSQVARQYDVNANLVFAWLRDPRFAETDAAEVARFLPAEIVAEATAPMAVPFADNHIAIELAGAHRMRIRGSYDPEALARLIRGLLM